MAEELKANRSMEYMNMIQSRRNAWKSKCKRLYGMVDKDFENPQMPPNEVCKLGELQHGEDFPQLWKMINEGIYGLYQDYKQGLESPF